jgi:hypothetical protein
MCLFTTKEMWGRLLVRDEERSPARAAQPICVRAFKKRFIASCALRIRPHSEQAL